MKKIISLALCAVMLLTSALIPVSAVEEHPEIEAVGDVVYVPANKILKSAYNLENETNYEYFVYFVDAENSENEVKIDFYDCFKEDKYVDVDTCEYKMYKGYRSSRAGYSKVSFNEGAYYQKIRIKVSDFYSEGYSMKKYDGELVYDTKYYFTENGDYYYYSREKGEFNFNFTNTKDVQESGMYVISGSAITAVKPDENGMIEFYAQKEISSLPYLSGVASEKSGVSTFTVHFGDRLTLGIGNVNLDKSVSVSDATLIQKYCSSLEDLSDTQKFLADVNGDGNVNIIDSTEIQKYCVGI